MNCFMTRGLAAIGLAGLLTTAAAAAPVANVYAESGPWTVESWTDGGDARMCSATIRNPSAQPDFGSYLRLENDGKGWAIASDYLISGNSADIDVLVDGASFPVSFALDGDVVRAAVDQGFVDAVLAGRRLNLNFDPSGQNFSLRGVAAALDVVQQCVQGSGLQNVGAAGTNDYNGYDIGGTPEAEETDYATVRGWRVVAAKIGGNFAYCAGETDDRGQIWRMGWDGMQWQVAVVADAQPDWNGMLDVDGDSRPISGSAKEGWTLLWLGMPEVDKIRNGNSMTVEVGRASIRHPLVGTAALITKIEECVERKGGGRQATAGAANAPRPAKMHAAAAADGCPDDGDRLPFTGICRGRAINYITAATNYGEANFPDPNCEWVVNEVQVVDDALLYRALSCKGVTAELEFAGGAQWAQLMVVRSALNAAYGDNPAVSDPKPAVWFNFIDPNNVEKDLDMRSRAGFEAELRGRKCAIRKAEPSLTPDGYVFDITPRDPMYKQRQEEPMPPLCGPFSAGDGVTRFWRVLGDQAFLFDLSADLYQDFDPDSVTLLRKDGSGNWYAVQ